MGNHDVVIIGGGHNGLVAACYLAGAGLDVVVVEKNAALGGMSSSGAVLDGLPDHVINHCAVDLVLWSAYPPARDLQLHRHGLRTIETDPPYAYLHPDGSSLCFWRDPRRTAEEIRRFSPADAGAYLEFVRFLSGLVDVGLPLSLVNPSRPPLRTLAGIGRQALRHRRDLKDFIPFTLSTSQEVIGERFEHPVTRAALSVLGGGVTPNTLVGSALTLVELAVFHRHPVHRPVGGMQAIPDALANCLRSRGGSALTGSGVRRITTRGRRVTGVELEDGRELSARHGVLATCDPRTALDRLLPAGTLPVTLERRVQQIPANGTGIGQLRIDAALCGQLTLPRHQKLRSDGCDLRHPMHFIGTPAEMERGFATAAAGLFPQSSDLGFMNAIPTAADPTQAPVGHDTFYVWCQTAPLHLNGGWDTQRDDVGKQVITHLSDFYDGFADFEIGRRVSTSENLAADVGATNGCVLHVDWLLNRTGPLRPARGLANFATPVENLYLGGSGCHSGGGVTGNAGRLAAAEVLRAASRKTKR